MIPVIFRITCATIIATAALAGGVALLVLLPAYIAVGAMFCGLVLFLVGAELRWPWAVVGFGGILMFAGVFAAALLDGLG